MLDLKVTTSRPSLPQFTSEKRKGLLHFLISHLLETIEYEVENKILPLKRVNNRNATDRVSVFIATGKLHARQNSVLKESTRKRCFSFATENTMKSILSRKVNRFKKYTTAS